MSRLIRTLSMAASLLAASPALAESGYPVEEDHVVDGRTALDPEMGYIYLQAPFRTAGIFIRVPNAEDWEAYNTRRAEALAEAIEDHPGEIGRWERAVERARTRGRDVPERPEEPNEENFAIGFIERQTMESFGPFFVFSKDDDTDTYSYLNAVPPGTYIWYGPVFLDPSAGYQGFCYCMGTVQFEVAPGVITDLGNFLFTAPRVADSPTAEMPQLQHSGGLNGARVGVADAIGETHFGLPASLANWPSVTADFSAVGKLNNYFGVMISRLAPIDGVLGYQRDRVIDIAADADVTDWAFTDPGAQPVVEVEVQLAEPVAEDVAEEEPAPAEAEADAG